MQNNISQRCFVGKNMEDKSKIKELNELENDDLILDIGPKTIKYN